MPKVSRHGRLCFIGKPAENIPFENRKIITIYANKLYCNICNFTPLNILNGTKSTQTKQSWDISFPCKVCL